MDGGEVSVEWKSWLRALACTAVIHLAIAGIWYYCEWRQYGKLITDDLGDNIVSQIYGWIILVLLYREIKRRGDREKGGST